MHEHEIVEIVNQNKPDMIEANDSRIVSEVESNSVVPVNGTVESDDVHASLHIRAISTDNNHVDVASSTNIGHAMQMRDKSGIVKPNPKFALHTELASVTEPNSIEEGLQHDGWLHA